MENTNNTKGILKDIIDDFLPDKFIRFFHEKNRKFRPLKDDLSQYNNNDFSEGTMLGEIDLDDNSQLVVCTFKVNNKKLTERSGKKAQYVLGKKILKDTARYAAGIFIFYDKNTNFRFSLIYDIPKPGAKRDWSNFKRFTYFVSKDLTNKTFINQMSEADFSSLEKIIEAFSVEKVTKEFYREISNWYFWAMDVVEFPDDEDKNREKRNAKNLIRLITRLIFVWFMKEKKLVPYTIFDKNFVDNIINYKDKTGSTYYKAILQNLFFATLNTKMKKDDSNSRIFIEEAEKFGFLNDAYLQQGYYRYSRFIKDKELFLKQFENVPFLNGGLFESLDKKINGREIRIDCFSNNVKNETRLKVPDELFFLENEKEVNLSKYFGNKKNTKVRGILTILKSYNFTIDENTPVDEEVALDPELLGKVFENLLAAYNPETATTARKATGSYYTPREIVDYMVNESLVEYLKTKLNDNNNSKENEEKIRTLFDYNKEYNPFEDDPQITNKIIDSIENIKILDPACGSGAFPMGILHKLVLALHKLDPENKIWKKRLLEKVPYEIREETEKSLQNKSLDYIRKLGLIEHCIYGVDIQEIAIQISKLRFFISLLVEQQIDDSKPNRDIRALPNLETKFVAANTLIGLDKLPDELLDSELEKTVRKLFYKREEIFYTNSRKEKLNLEKEEKKLRRELADILENKYKTIIEGKIKKLSEKTKLINQEIETLRQQPDEIEILETIDLFGDKRLRKINKTKEKINYLKRELNKYKKKIDEFNNPQNNSSITIAQKIADFDPFDQNTHSDWFDPEWMFGVKDGFDIVIGNPPYIQLQKNGGKLANKYKNMNYKTFDRTGDIYVLFYEKGNKLINRQGHLAFITSNKWMRAGYGKSLRKYLNENTTPKILVDLGPNVFEAATVDTNILIFQKGTRNIKCKACKIHATLNNNYISLAEYVKDNNIKIRNFTDDAWVILTPIEQKIKEKIEHIGTPLKNWNISIYRGIVTGLNEAFIIDGKKKEELIEKDSRSVEIIKPLLRGRDVKKYKAEFSDLWLINTHNGYINSEGKYISPIDVNNYPAIKEHLDKYWDKLKARQDKGKTPYNLRNCAYVEEFIKEKIIYPDIAENLSFYLDKQKCYMNNTAYFIAYSKWNRFLLSILNSKLINFYYHFISAQLGEKGTRHFRMYIEKLPIPKISELEQKPFIELVNKIIIKKELETDTSLEEKKLDIMIYKLYNLTSAEIKIIEGGQ